VADSCESGKDPLGSLKVGGFSSYRAAVGCSERTQVHGIRQVFNWLCRFKLN
jgi:hypothetical protein